ncbi:hypothetical protein N0V88_005363 [Collariella sp. IMI 366227]|nr:hypothetical protein N0V88_005363 [Collariella sp. IMI 366227]
MGIPNSVDSPESSHNGLEASQEPKEAHLDNVKPTHRQRLAQLVAKRFRSSEKGDDGRKGRAHTAAKRQKQETFAEGAFEGVDTPSDSEKAGAALEKYIGELKPVIDKAKSLGDASFEIPKEMEDILASYPKEQAAEYDKLRKDAIAQESSLGFEHACTKNAKDIEKKANTILQHLRKNDIERFYETAPKKRGYRGQEHPRFYGDHFLSNTDIIEKTQLFALCRAMPKGAHLHIHFNANLLPSVLLGIAKDMPRMFTWSNIPLDRDEAFGLCRIQFSIMNAAAVEDKGVGNPFDGNYQGGSVMQFQRFRETFPGGQEAADCWLQSKLVFQEEEAHHLLQTADGAWEKFNARTQMMKGLFNYETAYKRYTRQCLEEFVDDNIQYAEIRPNFMSSNQVWKDDGSSRIDNVGIMNLIIGEYEAFQKEHQREVLKGLKVIYCTPRSFDPKQIGEALYQCFQFKKDERFSSYIAGFDLVGEESKGKPLIEFRQQFLQFKALCKAGRVEIPLLLHCGETLDIGTSTDGNLFDALLIGAKRIGHGFALPRHPYVMEKMKERGTTEPYSIPPLHDFYQIMAGKPDMTLHGLRQLVEWSIEHSCMEPALMEEVRKSWEGINM